VLVEVGAKVDDKIDNRINDGYNIKSLNVRDVPL
jgi:hypothetical protein